MYTVLWLFIAWGSGFLNQQPVFVYGFAGALAILGAIRGWLGLRFDLLYTVHPSAWRTAYSVNVCTNAVTWSLAAVIIFWQFPSTPMAYFTAMLTSSFAFGGMASLMTVPAIQRFHVVALSAPAAITCMMIGSLEWFVLGLMFAILLIYNLSIGRQLTNQFLDGLAANELLSKRAVELEEARGQAESAAEIKALFLANMSHEIRTPMNAMTGMTRLALQTELTDKQRDYLNKAQMASESLLRIIDDILDFSKIEAGQLRLESVTFEMDNVLERLSSLIGLKAKEKGLELVFSTSADMHTALIGDPLRLEQVLVNLTSNAIKFTEQGEIVVSIRSIKCADSEAILEFSVRDTGIGLTSEHQTRLFMAFTQADTSTTRKYGGTGLGLAICKQIVEMMGGTISVESALDKGTVVSFTARFGVQQDRRTRSLSPDLKDKPVLVVDDNATSRDVLSEMLSTWGFLVTTAASGIQAIEAVERGPDAEDKSEFEVIFLDREMPDLDGLEVTSRIRKSGHATPVIMVTGDDQDTFRSLASGNHPDLSGVLVKPFNQSSLFDLVAKLFGQENAYPDHGFVTDKRKGTRESALHGIRVLVVEDNEINQQIAVEFLGNAGVIVQVANNGAEAVKLLCETPLSEPFDAVLMDVQMPEMDGYDATRAIRADARHAQLPIIAMTAHALDEERQRCLAAGMNEHIAKPIEPERLIDALRHWLPAKAEPPYAQTRIEKSTGSENRLPDEVPGILIREGLSRVCGNQILYSNLLDNFRRTQAGTVTEIRKSIEEGDQQTASALIHTLAGVAGNLAAREIHALARNLESAMQNSPQVSPIAQLMKLEEALTLTMSSIDTLELEKGFSTTVSTESGSQLTTAELERALTGLKEKLEKRDLAAVKAFQSIRSQIDVRLYSSIFEQLGTQLDDLDFEGAIITVESLLHDVVIESKSTEG